METKQPTWLILIAVGAGTFMSALLGSVMNTILPVLQDVFHSDVSAIGWIITIYLLVVSGFLLTFGRVGDLIGHKKVYLAGFVVFILSSLLCGFAWSVPALIVFRGFQAVGGAMLAAASPAILTDAIPSSQRGRAFGLVSTITYVGLTIGPSLGGWLTYVLGWQAIFFINIPIGIAALILSWVYIPKDKTKENAQQFDFLGAFVFITGLTLLLLSLNKGSKWGWTSLLTLGLLTAALILLFVFIKIEQKSDHPMLHLSLFSSHLFSASAVSAVLNYICLYSITFLMPFYFLQGRGMNSAETGLLLTIQPVLMAITAPISGAFSDKIGSRNLGMMGMALLAAGQVMLSTSGAQTPLWFVVLSLGITGIGIGLFISPNTSALMGSAPRTMQGVASGVLGTTRSIGMVLGIGLAGAIFATQLASDASDALYRGISQGLLVAGGVALLGIVTSAIKKEGKRVETA